MLETKQIINAIKHAKKRYFSDNLEASKGNPRKTWNLINELSSRNTSKSLNILETQVDNRTISTSGDMAEAFNEHLTNIGQVQAQEVPTAQVNPEFYLSYTDKAFCLKTPSLDVVFNQLRKIDEKKATGIDMIPSKSLKMACWYCCSLVYRHIYKVSYHWDLFNRMENGQGNSGV